MGVVLTILKIIGILLLILLGLILFIILSILFIPFCYRARIEKIPKGVDADASVSWFFGAIRVCIDFSWAKGSGKKVTKDIRLFGVSLVKIKNWLRNRKKMRAEQARQHRREERIRQLEELRLNDPEAFEKKRQKALARRRRRKAKEAEEIAQAVSGEGESVEAPPPGQMAVPAAVSGTSPETLAETGSETVSEAAYEDSPEEEFAELDLINEVEAAEKKSEKAAAKNPLELFKRRLKSVGYTIRRKLRETFVKNDKKESGQKETGEGAPKRPQKSVAAQFFDYFDHFDDIIIKLLDLLDELPLRVVNFLLALPGKLWNLIVKAFGRLEKTIITLRKFISFSQDYRTRAFIRQVFRTIRKLLGHIFPKRISGFLRFGFSDPSWTGITLGALAMIDPGVRGDFRYEPDFEEPILEGEVAFKGRLYLFYPLYLGARLYFSKNTKFVIGFFKKNRKKKKSGAKETAENINTIGEEVA